MTPFRHMVSGLMFSICLIWHWAISVLNCSVLFSITSLAFSKGLISTYIESTLRLWFLCLCLNYCFDGGCAILGVVTLNSWQCRSVKTLPFTVRDQPCSWLIKDWSLQVSCKMSFFKLKLWLTNSLFSTSNQREMPGKLWASVSVVRSTHRLYNTTQIMDIIKLIFKNVIISDSSWCPSL